MNENRVRVQNDAVGTWCKNPKSTLNLCTGLGKTKIAIDVIEIVKKKIESEGKVMKCLIIVPTEIIRDVVFPKEFVKFGKKDLLKYCEIKCIQSVYKHIGQEYDLVVCDEIHNYLYEETDTKAYEYFKFFEQNTYRYILGLSASIDVKRLPALNRIAPICFTFTIDQAAALGIVAPFKIYNVKLSLTEDEKVAYNKLQRSYNYYEHLLGGRYEAYKNSNIFLGKDYSSEQRSSALAYKSLIKKRKSILDNSFNKIAVCKLILSYFPNSNGIIFSESIEQSGKYIEDNEKAIGYHSKMKAKERISAINRLNDKRTKVRYISAVKALNEGLSIDSIVFAVITAGNSKVKDMIQRLGRSCRFVEGKNAIIFRLFIEGTQEEKWVTSSQREFDQSNISWITEQQLTQLLNNIETK